MGITAGELALERDDQERWLPDTTTRTRRTLVADGVGGHTSAVATTDYACRIAPTTGRELEIAARVTHLATVTITLPYSADVIAGDALAVGTRTFRVVAALDTGAWRAALRVLAVEAS